MARARADFRGSTAHRARDPEQSARGAGHGLPVVGTTSATQGLEGQAGREFIVANSAAEQAAAIARLFDAPDEALALGRRGREFVEREYDWERVLEPLDRLLERLSPKSQSAAALKRT